MPRSPGRHFLQLPGPSNTPDRILRAISAPVIDHRGPGFQALARHVLDGIKPVLGTQSRCFIYPSSATGAWEAAITNTLSPGDTALFFDRGHFGERWAKVAERLGVRAEIVPGDWRVGATPDEVEERLRADTARRIKAVMIVHNETSTGVTTPLPPIRQAMDAAGHDALLMVDAVSTIGATDYQHDAWGIDVTVTGSQKALMLPPGLSFVAASARALEARHTASLPRSYWDWSDMMEFNDRSFFPYTPATNLLFGLREALTMLHEEGLANVYARHARHAAATRAAVDAWGLENYALKPEEFAAAATSILVPEGSDADALRRIILDRFDMSLGKGLGRVEGKVFRIGHLGDFNDLMLVGTLGGVEMGLELAEIPHRQGGVNAAMEILAS